MYNAAVWLREIERLQGEPLQITWRCFPLEQANATDEAYQFWEQSLEDAKSLRAFLAAEAVREQGEEQFRQFHFALLQAVHERKEAVGSEDTIRTAAEQVAHLDVPRMMRDMQEPELRQRIERDYREGYSRYGVFGTPTMVLDGGDAVFVKTSPPPGDQALAMFEEVRSMSCARPYLRELKKPTPPEQGL